MSEIKLWPRYRGVLRSTVARALEEYFNHHVKTGGYLRAVLENHLWLAVKRADSRSLIKLPAVIDLLLEHAPPASWGSPEIVAAWLQKRPAREYSGESVRP